MGRWQVRNAAQEHRGYLRHSHPKLTFEMWISSRKIGNLFPDYSQLYHWVTILQEQLLWDFLCCTWWITNLTHIHLEDIAKRFQISTEAKNISFNNLDNRPWSDSSSHETTVPVRQNAGKFWNASPLHDAMQSWFCHRFPIVFWLGNSK